MSGQGYGNQEDIAETEKAKAPATPKGAGGKPDDCKPARPDEGVTATPGDGAGPSKQHGDEADPGVG